MKIPIFTTFFLAAASLVIAADSQLAGLGGTTPIASSTTSSPATVATEAPSSSQSIYTFEDFSRDEERIYDINKGSQAKILLSQSVDHVTSIEIYSKDLDAAPGDLVESYNPNSTSNQAILTVAGNAGRGPPITITVALSELLHEEPKLYYLKTGINEVQGQNINLYSPLFAVTNGQQGSYDSVSTELTSDTPFVPSDTLSSSTTTREMPNASPSKAVDSSDEKKRGGGGGLSTGAIVGIAVGAAVALIIIMALLWFLFRRRKQAHSHTADVSTPLAAGYGGAAGSRDFMGDKEAGVMVAESPQSQAYTDQPDPRHSTLSGAAIIGSATAAPANASYTESGHQAYDETVPAGNSPTDQQPPHHGSASGNRGVDSPVPSAGVTRHLVDEDMTADEIARLEAEERELDRQIQEAGRRRQ